MAIKARDSGDVDTSASQTLNIIIPANPFPKLPETFTGLFGDTNSPWLGTMGFFNLTLDGDGSFNGYLLNASGTNLFNGQFSISPSFATYASVTTADYTLNLSVNASAQWTEMISGSASNATGAWNATLQGYLPGYSDSFQTPLAGDYHMVLPDLEDSAAGPSGESVFDVLISSNGVAALAGYLADGTFVSQAQPLSLAGYCPVYVPLYGTNNGLLIGWLDFTGATPDSVSTNSALMWFNPAGATLLYIAGFTNSSTPIASPYDSTLANLMGFGSGTVILSGGSLTTPITNAVTASNYVITVDPAATDGLSLYLDGTAGEVFGSFISPDNHTNYIESIILQGEDFVPGYFIEANTNWYGSFILLGN